MHARLDPVKLEDVQTVANKLSNLPKDALIYISGYVEGRHDAMEQQEDQPQHSTPPPAIRPNA